MQTNDFIQANRKMWNETAAIHAQGYVSTLWERIKAPDYSTFDAVERRIFAQIGLADKTVIQLCCNNGRELIAIKKAGAKRCVGIDISDNFIAQGQQLAQHAGVTINELCIFALREYVERRRKRTITARINAVCDQVDTRLDPVIQSIQALSIPKEEW